MSEVAVSRYVQIRNATTTPGELLLALYDGLFRFLNGAKLCLERKEVTRARELLSRVYGILSELYIALDHAVYPELCANLAGVYGFCMDRVTFASRKADIAAIEETLRVLNPLREAWQVAVPHAAREQAEEGNTK